MKQQYIFASTVLVASILGLSVYVANMNVNNKEPPARAYGLVNNIAVPSKSVERVALQKKNIDLENPDGRSINNVTELSQGDVAHGVIPIITESKRQDKKESNKMQQTTNDFATDDLYFLDKLYWWVKAYNLNKNSSN